MNFQTPPAVCDYMVNLLPPGTRTVLEPTPGMGNLVKALNKYEVTAPDDFWKMSYQFFDAVVMNPPVFADEYIGSAQREVV